jgi:hypothetical protein
MQQINLLPKKFYRIGSGFKKSLIVQSKSQKILKEKSLKWRVETWKKKEGDLRPVL